MSALEKILLDKIRAEGPLSFEAFMDAALYYPGLGYYMKRGTGFGRAGDYYTSPHLHALFGAVLGLQMEEMWEILGRPDTFQVVEIGAGSGHLAEDMLRYLSRKDVFGHLEYTIVERSPFTREVQQERLRSFAGLVGWRSGLSEVQRVTGCILSNELLDAFPVRTVVMEEGLMEIRVGAAGDRFVEIPVPADDVIHRYFQEFSVDPGTSFPKGYRTEVHLAMRGWVDEISRALARGFVLTIDYGYSAREYYSGERSAGTLLCYRGHRLAEDPFRDVGEQDITAHVNFSALRKWSEEAGLETLGFTAQGPYLISLGIDVVVRELFGDEPNPHEISKVKGLILPQGMGESHKVMVTSRGVGTPRLSGFAMRNMLRKL